MNEYPWWMTYHLGKLLIIGKSIKNIKEETASLGGLNYFTFISRKYLQYLNVIEIDFNTF